jgi:multidrug efflux pump subunit AcrA (membrane-fusion protein)
VIARLDDRGARLRVRQSVAAEHQAEAALGQAQARLGSRAGEAFNPSEVPEAQAARQQYEAAEAQARLAEKNAQRYANLVKTGDVANSVYDQARAQAETARAQANAARQQYEVTINTAHQGNQSVAAAQAALEAARAQTALAREALDNTIIRAPFAGHVSERPVAPGESVSTTTKVATIQRLNPIKLQLQLSETDAGHAQIGMEVTAKVAAHPQLEFTGWVTAINPALDPASHAITVEARLDNPRNLLRPGMFATARLLVSGGERAVFVPRSAVINDAATNSSRVFVIEGNVARVRVTQTGETENDLIRCNVVYPLNHFR